MLMQVIDHAPASAPLRFACLCHTLDATADGATPGLPQLHALCERWRVDADSRELAVLVAREWPLMHGPDAFGPLQCLALLDRCDAWRRPARLDMMLSAFEALARAGPVDTSAALLRRCERARRALRAAQGVSVASLPPDVRRNAADGPALGQALRQARLQAISQAIAWV